MGGSLTIVPSAAVDMTGTTPMTVPLNVLGNVLNLGSLILSSSPGGDINVGGSNWDNFGTFTANGRTVTLNGTGTQRITGDCTFYNLVRTVRPAADAVFVGQHYHRHKLTHLERCRRQSNDPNRFTKWVNLESDRTGHAER